MARSWRYSPRHAFLPRWLIFLSAGLAACGGSGTDSASGALASRQLAAATIDNRYQVTNLSLEGSSKGFVTPKGINATGQVAGYIMVEGKKRAFMFDGSSMRDLGTLGGENSEAVAINDAGQVAGNAQVPDGFYHAFRYDPDNVNGQIVELESRESRTTGINASGHVIGELIDGDVPYIHDGGTLQTLGVGYSAAKAINDDGFVVGCSIDPVPNSFFYDGNTLTFLSKTTLRKYDSEDFFASASAIALNNAGQFITTINFHSHSSTQVAFTHAAIWNDINTSQLIGLPDESRSIALDINDVSQVLGQSWNAAGKSRGFVWMPAGEIADIGNLGGDETIPVSFNLSGQAIGQSQNADGEWRAFAWTASQGMVDLNTRLRNAPDGLVLENALAIADNGSIVALTNEGDLVLLTTAADNTAPVAGSIASADMVAVNTPLDFSVNFTDANAFGIPTAIWNWGDGSTGSGAISGTPEAGTVSGSHAFTAAGIYTVSIAISDDEGLSTQISRTVVVVDPKAGAVAGIGQFTSPPGAYKNKPTQSGKTEFLFASSYLPGKTVKLGSSTLFHFRAAGMSFITTSADWLVVSGARADSAGTGVLNGKKGYRYQLTAIDGARVGRGAKDRLRMRIWSVDAEGQEVVAYDNQLDPAGAGTPDEGSTLGAGQISILGN
ncbi:MAG: PKD domain-containing protein [Noviherbaspirillum sp.]